MQSPVEKKRIPKNISQSYALIVATITYIHIDNGVCGTESYWPKLSKNILDLVIKKSSGARLVRKLYMYHIYKFINYITICKHIHSILIRYVTVAFQRSTAIVCFRWKRVATILFSSSLIYCIITATKPCSCLFVFLDYMANRLCRKMIAYTKKIEFIFVTLKKYSYI